MKILQYDKLTCFKLLSDMKMPVTVSPCNVLHGIRLIIICAPWSRHKITQVFNVFYLQCSTHWGTHCRKSLQYIPLCVLTFILKIYYSRTSCKWPPKMQRLSGRLQELNHRGLFWEEVQTHLLYERSLLHIMSKLCHV